VEDTVFICRFGAPYQLWVKPEAGHHIQWYDKNQNPLNNPPTVTIYGNEEYEFYLSQVESRLGCVSEKERVIVKKNTKPIIFLSASVKNVCTPEEGNTGGIDLIATGGSEPYLYVWSTGAKTQNLVNVPAGDYKVVVEDIYGCSDSAYYSVKSQAQIAVRLKIEQSYDCATAIGTQTTILTNISGGTAPYKLEWIIDGVTVEQGDTLITSPDNETVTLWVTDDRRCETDSTFTTSIPDYGVYPSVINCNDHLYRFDAVVYGASGNAYLWEFGDGQTSTDRSPQMQFKQSGEYEASLTVSNSISGDNCTYRQNYEVYAIPDVIAPDVQFCIGDSAVAIVTGTADYYIWRYRNKADTTDTYVINTPGEYTIKVMTENGCWKSIAINASYYPYYQYQIYTDRREVTPDNPAVQISTDHVTGSFLTWDFGDGNTIEDRNDLTYIYDISQDTRYLLALSAINPHGCPETASVFIHVNLIPLANTFTPNGDGVHDVFLKGWRIEVFNRNGVLLYEGTEGWDGTYKGVPVSSDTYFYCLYDETETGTKRHVNYVTIIR
jgi:gliding motility-associated-like protein